MKCDGPFPFGTDSNMNRARYGHANLVFRSLSCIVHYTSKSSYHGVLVPVELAVKGNGDLNWRCRPSVGNKVSVLSLGHVRRAWTASLHTRELRTNQGDVLQFYEMRICAEANCYGAGPKRVAGQPDLSTPYV